MNGQTLQQAIMEAASVLGWRTAHFRPARTKHGWATAVAGDGKGWPDLILVRDRLVVVEVKGDGDRMRPEQTAWVNALLAAGVETYVWRPVDWLDGTVERTLRPEVTCERT